MPNALNVAWETIRDWWHGMVGLAALNLIWLGMSLTVLLLPPATAGLYGATHSLAHGKGARLGDFVDTARRCGWVSLRWALVNLFAGALWAVNYVFYGTAESGFALVIQIALISAGALWLVVQFYVWPFLMEQEQLSLRMALRNALFLTLANPLYSLVLLVISGLVIMLSLTTVLPFAVFTASFLSLLGNRAVIERLTVYGKLPSPAQSINSGDTL